MTRYVVLVITAVMFNTVSADDCFNFTSAVEKFKDLPQECSPKPDDDNCKNDYRSCILKPIGIFNDDVNDIDREKFATFVEQYATSDEIKNNVSQDLAQCDSSDDSDDKIAAYLECFKKTYVAKNCPAESVDLAQTYSDLLDIVNKGCSKSK